MIRTQLHQQTMQKMDAICNWFKSQSAALPYPIYSSYDIRDSGYKVVNVDANIYPAGFNNICPTDKESTPEHFDEYFRLHYSVPIQNILLVTEEHTSNPYYWDNVWTIQDLIQQTGRQIRVAIPQNLDSEFLTLTSASGKTVHVYSAYPEKFSDFVPDIIISNNDFSNPYPEWAEKMSAYTINPPREIGWYQRKKSRYFYHYNQLVNEFAKVAEIDPFVLRVETELFSDFDINSEESRNLLAEKVDQMIARLKSDYIQRGIQQEPFVFVKNNSGTYGLAVIRVGSGAEVKEWTYKSRKKMKAAKGGRDVEEVIIQEGIPSIVQSDGASAEPVIYMVGSHLAGGFLRTHNEKSATDSLNSPGAVYKRLCVSDLAVDTARCPLENVYGWSAKLGLLAIGREAHEMNVVFKKFINQAASCSK